MMNGNGSFLVSILSRFFEKGHSDTTKTNSDLAASSAVLVGKIALLRHV